MKNSLIFILLLNLVSAFGQKIKSTNIDDNSFRYALIEASRQKLTGNIKEAIVLYQNCIKTNPACDIAFYELGTIYPALNDNKKAEENLKTAFEIDPGNYWYGIAYSDILKVNNKMKESLEVLRKIRELNLKNSMTVNFKIAEIYSDAGKYKSTIRILNEIEKENGISEMVSFMKIETYKKMKKYKLAERELITLIKSNPDYSGYRILIAEFYAEIKDTTKAIAAYEEAFKLDSTSIYAITNLADLFTKKGINQKAFYYLKRTFENDNISIGNKIQTVSIIIKDTTILKDDRETIEELVKILLNKYPDNIDVKTVAYDFYNGLGNHIYALALVKQILEKRSDIYIIWRQALYNASMIENFDEMIEIGTKAIKKYPNKAELYLLVGRAFYEKKEFDSAYNKFNKGYGFIKELEHNIIQYLFYFAESAYKTKRKNEAFKYYDELLKIDPENNIIKNNYSYFLALEGKQLDKAKKLSGETILIEPENSTYLDTYGWILFTLNDYEEAKKYLEKALKYSDKEDPDILFHYAETLRKLGLYKNSKIYYLRAGEFGFDKEVIKQRLFEIAKDE